MTARYRCCWCGSAVSKSAKTMREHVVKVHRRALEIGLHPIMHSEARKEAIAP